MDYISSLFRSHAYVTGNFKKGTRIEQLWKLKTDSKQLSPVVNMNADEYREWYLGIKKKYKLR